MMQSAARAQSHGFAAHREIRILSTASGCTASRLRSAVKQRGALKQEGVEKRSAKQGLDVQTTKY